MPVRTTYKPVHLLDATYRLFKFTDGSETLEIKGICPTCGENLLNIQNPQSCWNCKTPIDYDLGDIKPEVIEIKQ